ncbi:hypothetical protein KMI_02g03190 [Encephalitozoon hellem]|nr:hypothetical protein KMI_02g03190 [Encephalitozoon hellem]
MDVQGLRKEREACIKERSLLADEMDSFIVDHLEEIREALTMEDVTANKISSEELLMFISWRVSRLVRSIRDKKIEILSGLIEKRMDCECLEDILAAEYCCKRILANDPAECPVLDADVYIDTRNGIVDIKSDRFQRVIVGADKVIYRSLENLFSEAFHMKVSRELMLSYTLNVKLEMGLEMFRGLYEKPLDTLKALSSYKHYKEKGIPILVKKDGASHDLLEKVRAEIEKEMAGIIEKEFSDEKKALLINYLLVMFGGIGSDLDLSYFDGKREAYMLDWRKFESNTFTQNTNTS